MRKLQINIIGLGKVGQTLAKLFAENPHTTLLGIVAKNLAQGQSAHDFIGDGEIYTEINAMPAADLIFITTNDANISTVAKQLSKSPRLRSGSVVVHCSGALGEDILHCLVERGCHVASVHPMHSFIIPELSAKNFLGTYCAVSGTSSAVAMVYKVMSWIGAKTFAVDPKRKALYHSGGVFAANYLLTLAASALQCFSGAKINDDNALGIVISLMQSTLNNLQQLQSPQQALTGPLRRGDHATVAAHLQALPTAVERELYEVLAARTKELLL